MQVAFYIPQYINGAGPQWLYAVQAMEPYLQQAGVQCTVVSGMEAPVRYPGQWQILPKSGLRDLPAVGPWLARRWWQQLPVRAVVGMDDALPPASQPRWQWITGMGKQPPAAMLRRKDVRWLSSIPQSGPANLLAPVIPPLALAPPASPGAAYFLCVANDANADRLVQLLRAFSLFKKWQRSSMLLVLHGVSQKVAAALAPRLASYKYRTDVVMADEQSPLGAWLPDAYACLVPAHNQPYGRLAAMQAMQCGVPLVATHNLWGDAWYGGATIQPAKADPELWAEAIKQLYKDEAWRHQLVVKGKDAAAAWTGQTTASQLLEQLLPA